MSVCGAEDDFEGMLVFGFCVLLCLLDGLLVFASQ